MSKLLNFSTTSGGGALSKKEFTSARVIDIILNPSHPKYKNVDSIGTIFYSNIETKKKTTSPETLPLAIPLFTFQKYFPLINEIVLLISIDINNSSKKTEKKVFYLPNINLWNNPHHNAMPITSNYQSDNKKFSNSQDGLSTKQSSNNSIEILLGETFKEKDFIKPLRPFEGDNILEGRLGNSIRLGSTSKPLNPWSQNGENSDPIIIIRNGQFNDINDDTFIPNIENINNDDSSIYLTSNQNINNFEVASKNMQSYGKEMDKSYISPEDQLTKPFEEDIE